MTDKAQRQDREDARDDREQSSTELSAEAAHERATQNDVNVEASSECDAAEAPRARARRAPRKSAPEAETPTAATQEPLTLSPVEADEMELEAQGFTSEEALRLIEMSKRLETSAEARASQAELKRLRFAQWLIERGILDEFRV
ncbi:MAG: hypothetical protein KGO05_08040 [Chloroflexota bacterium]|nr:hypothetical protein [Chloroflexota bacterium]